MRTTRPPSYGDTLLGLIIGLVLGLLLALGVTMFVNDVPMPFVDKGTSRSADPSATEVESNKNWDPNKPLYGKNPTSTTDIPKSELGSIAVPSVADQIPEKEAVVRDGESVSEQPDAPSLVQYQVQVGAFRNGKEADALRAKLSLAGHDSKISVVEVAGQPMHRVRIGPLSTKEQAEQIQQQLSAASIVSTVIKGQ